MTEKCKICCSVTEPFSEATVLGKYHVRYFRCPDCGFIQTENPYWLEEAYSRPINVSDTGIMVRNIANARMVSAVLKLCFHTDSKYADYGGGHGIFVRMMRDRGFDFYRDDKFCDNLFASGFDVSDSGVNRFELVTAFEVFEHFLSPCNEIDNLLQKSDSILFTTELLPDDPPPPTEWWYYCLDNGQHISFYTRKSLSKLAETFGLDYYSHGKINLFTKSKKSTSPFMFRLATHPRIIGLLDLISGSGSYTEADHKRITGVEMINR